MVKFLKTILFAFLLCCSASLKAQDSAAYNPSRLYEPRQLHDDLAFLKHVLQEAHPSMYRYTPKDSLELYFNNADKQITGPMTEHEFWKLVAPLVNAIRSGHTGIYPSAAYVSWKNHNPTDILPLLIYTQNDRMYAARLVFNTTEIPEGVEILSIDDNPAQAILKTLKPYLPAEGYSDQFKSNAIESGYFDILYGDLFGYKPFYKITYLDSAGIQKSALIQAKKGRYGHSVDENQAFLEQQKDELDKSVEVSYFNNVPGAVKLKIKRLTYFNYYKSFDETFFKRISDEKIKSLIIDLRGDAGGYAAIAVDMMRYLITGYCNNARSITTTTNKLSFEPYIVNGNHAFSERQLIGSWHGYSVPGADANIPCYVDNNYRKNVYVLIDKGTFSAASIFVANLKAQRKITVIGEETGGGEAGTDGMQFSVVRMPNTSLLLNLPQFWIATTTKTKKPGYGVMPDIVITPTIADKVKHNDIVLIKTLQMIAAQNAAKN